MGYTAGVNRWRATAFFLGVFAASCGKQMQVALPPPSPAVVGAVETGMASWYGHPYHGRTTSNGETYDMRQMTAAHLSLPFDTRVRVTNLANDRSVVLRINDRGPFLKNRIIDVSRAAAERLGMIAPGTVKVRVEVVAAPTVVQPSVQQVSASVPAETTPCAGPAYGVQVGSFRNAANAQGVLEGLARDYSQARIVAVDADGGTLYRVVVGAESQAGARQALRELEQDGRDGFVTRVPANSSCIAAAAD